MVYHSYNLFSRAADKRFAERAHDFMREMAEKMGVQIFMLVGYRSGTGDLIKARQAYIPCLINCVCALTTVTNIDWKQSELVQVLKNFSQFLGRLVRRYGKTGTNTFTMSLMVGKPTCNQFHKIAKQFQNLRMWKMTFPGS
jgi:hypothetical protein